MAGEKLVAVENASDNIVTCDSDQQPDGFNDVWRGCIALATAAARQPWNSV